MKKGHKSNFAASSLGKLQLSIDLGKAREANNFHAHA